MKALIYGLAFFAGSVMAADDNPRLKVVQDKVQVAKENYFTGKEELGLTKHAVTTPLDIWDATCYKIPLKGCKVPRDAWGKYTGLPLPPEPVEDLEPVQDDTAVSDTGTSDSGTGTSTSGSGTTTSNGVPLQ